MRSTRLKKRSLIENLEPREFFAADLIVTNFEIDQPTSPMRPANGHLTGDIIIQNAGLTKTTGSFTVAIVLEDNPRSGEEGRKILYNGFVTKQLALGATATLNFDITLPSVQGYDVEDNDLYLSAWVDAGGQVPEVSDDNNRYRGLNIDYYRFPAEENLKVNPGASSPTNVAPFQAAEFFPWQGAIGDEVAGATDIDVFSLDVTGSRTLEIGLRDTTFDAAIRVYDQNWNLIASNDNHISETNPKDPWVLIQTGAGGKRYVVVSSTQNLVSDPFRLDLRRAGETGQYTLYEKVYTMPTVTVGPVTSGTVYENSGDASTVSFFVERTGSTEHALFVPFNVTGSAGLNRDVIAPAGITIMPGQSRAWVNVTAINDDVIEPPEYINFEIKDFQPDFWVGSPRNYTMTVRENPSLVGPRAMAGGFLFDDFAGPRLFVQFDDLISGFEASDFLVTNLTTGQTVTQTRAVNSPNGDTAILFFDAPLADGNYRATFRKNGVMNSHGGWNNDPYSFDFFSLRGDANHDRKVDFNDLVTLAQNYGRTSGQVFHNGDFNYDGRVDFNDLVILAQQYGKQLAAAPAMAEVRADEVRKRTAIQRIAV